VAEQTCFHCHFCPGDLVVISRHPFSFSSISILLVTPPAIHLPPFSRFRFHLHIAMNRRIECRSEGCGGEVVFKTVEGVYPDPLDRRPGGIRNQTGRGSPNGYHRHSSIGSPVVSAYCKMRKGLSIFIEDEHSRSGQTLAIISSGKKVATTRDLRTTPSVLSVCYLHVPRPGICNLCSTRPLS